MQLLAARAWSTASRTYIAVMLDRERREEEEYLGSSGSVATDSNLPNALEISDEHIAFDKKCKFLEDRQQVSNRVQQLLSVSFRHNYARYQFYKSLQVLPSQASTRSAQNPPLRKVRD